PDGVAGEEMRRGRFLTGHGLAGERGSEGIGLEQMDQLFGAPGWDRTSNPCLRRVPNAVFGCSQTFSIPFKISYLVFLCSGT
ncbi:hypothetical protein, partial [Paraburkholderia phenoliruptrix]|uniref:hypothetical protein n=1 Tax=Paraburkholderia phenoliruptrix TaxID=252970 RepID=UPI001C6F23F0